MDNDGRVLATWEEIVAFANQLKESAQNGRATPEDGVRLAELVLEFQERMAAVPPSSRSERSTVTRRT